jgi:hypothetical protein
LGRAELLVFVETRFGSGHEIRRVKIQAFAGAKAGEVTIRIGVKVGVPAGVKPQQVPDFYSYLGRDPLDFSFGGSHS